MIMHLKAHARRFKKFCELAKTPQYQSEDPRRIAAAINKPLVQTQTDKPTISRRALKRVCIVSIAIRTAFELFFLVGEIRVS